MKSINILKRVFARSMLLLGVALFSQIFFQPLGHAHSIGIGENWQVEAAGNTFDVVRLDGSVGRWFPEAKDQQVFRYSKEFQTKFSQKSEDMYLILPPNWANLKVILNEQTILDERIQGRTLGRIFAERIIAFPAKILREKNKLVIEAEGHPLRLGFRSAAAKITDHLGDARAANLRNLIFNDSHVIFILLAIVIAAVSLWILNFAGESTGVLRHLGWTTVGVIPHHLLATDFYRGFVDSEEFPFKLQMIFQLFSWFTFILLLSGINEKKFSWIEKFRTCVPRTTFAKLSFAVVSVFLLFLPFTVFALVVYPLFMILCLTGMILTILMHKDARGILMMAGTFLCVTTLLSDVFFGNLYLMGHGTAVFSIVCVSILGYTYKTSFLHGRAFSEIVKYSLPNSVHQRISGLISQGEPIEKIRSFVSGNDVLSIVLVDICDWGKMNDLHQSKIPAGLLRQARSHAFARFEKINADYSFDLLKTTGDNMMFVGGLFQAENAKQISLAAQTLQAVRSLMECIDEVNAQLRTKNLPSIKVKVSAAMGDCEYGLEMYNKRLQFDVQGHPVNSAYRIEASMDDEFYHKYGRNVAAVSSTVIFPCEELSLRKRFPILHKFCDKHGIEYECYIAEQYEENLDVGDFAQALFGLYSHVKPSQPTQSVLPVTAVEEVSGVRSDLRAGRRKKLYLNDGFEVELNKDGHVWKARALDLSESGMAIALHRDSQFNAMRGELLDLNFKIDNHDISLRAEVASTSPLGSKDSNIQRFGLRFALPLRSRSERRWKRFSVSEAVPPSVTLRDAIDSRRSAVGTCVDVSAGGLGVRLNASDVLLLPGMKKMVYFQPPGEDKIEIETEVKYVRADGDSFLRVGLEMLGDLSKIHESCGAYLVAAGRGDVSFADVRNGGFSLAGIRRLLEVKYPSCEDEENQILHLRRLMLGEHVLLDGNPDAVDVRDRFDSHSRQIICKVGERVVAAVRVVFNDKSKERMEHLSYGAQIPDELTQDGFVECSRLIVHPEFRGDDILWTLMAEIGRVTLTTGHRYILQSCSEELFPLYERFGFKSCGTFVDSGKNWILNVLDVESGVRGRSSSGVAWALVYSQLLETMQHRHQFKVDLFDKARTSLLESTRPLVLAQYRKVRARSGKKKISKVS